MNFYGSYLVFLVKHSVGTIHELSVVKKYMAVYYGRFMNRPYKKRKTAGVYKHLQSLCIHIWKFRKP